MNISVVIPSFNRQGTLVRALNSVLSQSSVVNEIIVVDDGSRDNTVNIIQQQFPTVKLIRQTNQGVSSARNTGIKAFHERRSSEERLKILFESAPDAYYLTDLKGTIIDGNKAAEELLGYKREELIGKNFIVLACFHTRVVLVCM